MTRKKILVGDLVLFRRNFSLVMNLFTQVTRRGIGYQYSLYL